MYIGTTGVKRKQPLCIYCHEDAVKGAGRSSAKVSRYFSEPSEQHSGHFGTNILNLEYRAWVK
jgi:hypothetical protein